MYKVGVKVGVESAKNGLLKAKKCTKWGLFAAKMTIFCPSNLSTQ